MQRSNERFHTNMIGKVCIPAGVSQRNKSTYLPVEML